MVWEKNGKCAVFRIEATNNEDRTLDDVYLRIGSLTATTDALTETARPLVGHNLAVASDPFDTARHPMERPRDSTTMHPGGSAIFDVVRLCKDASSNGRLMHGSYERHFHAVQMEQAGASPMVQKPRGVLANGEYVLVLDVMGRNLSLSHKTIKFSWSDTGIVFHMS